MPGRSSLWGDPTDALAFNAVRRALTCLESRGSSRPLVALSPERLVHFHRFHRRLRNVQGASAGKFAPESFCALRKFGLCTNTIHHSPLYVFAHAWNQVCRCLLGFTGDRCDIYPGRCWLLHCFLDDCYSARGARLRCVCDPLLYGTRVLSGLYWYNDGLQGSYRPPPPSWIDVVPKQGSEPESYAMDGVDEEVDLSLYKEAIGAVTARVRVSSSSTRRERRRFSNKTILSFLASQMWKMQGAKMVLMKNETTQPTTTMGNLLDSCGKYLCGVRHLVHTFSLHFLCEESTNYRRLDSSAGVAAKTARSTLEKDFGADAKFVYEEYSNLAEPLVTSGSSVLAPLSVAWPLLGVYFYDALS
ncbi:uncharacterized protein LOC144139788 [Haemaphysalis longicornis]